MTDLDDARAELQTRGFSGFGTAELDRYINWGYFEVARRTRWAWEETSDTFTLTAGTDTQVIDANNLPNMKAVKHLYITTDNDERGLQYMSDEDFAAYLMTRPVAANKRSCPMQYYLWQNKVWVYPCPNKSYDFECQYWQKVTKLVEGGTEDYITPDEFDEAILLAAEVRCHRRAREYDRALEARSELLLIFDDLEVEDRMKDWENQHRVKPDPALQDWGTY